MTTSCVVYFSHPSYSGCAQCVGNKQVKEACWLSGDLMPCVWKVAGSSPTLRLERRRVGTLAKAFTHGDLLCFFTVDCYLHILLLLPCLSSLPSFSLVLIFNRYSLVV